MRLEQAPGSVAEGDGRWTARGAALSGLGAGVARLCAWRDACALARRLDETQRRGRTARNVPPDARAAHAAARVVEVGRALVVEVSRADLCLVGGGRVDVGQGRRRHEERQRDGCEDPVQRSLSRHHGRMGYHSVAPPGNPPCPEDRQDAAQAAGSARLLMRVFEADALRCPECGGGVRLLAAIEDPEVACKILACLDLPVRAPPILPARSSALMSLVGPAYLAGSARRRATAAAGPVTREG